MSSLNMSWESFWTYIKSPLCSEEQREESLKALDLPNVISTSTNNVLIEILEFAPDEIKESLRDSLPLVVRVTISRKRR